MLWRRRKNRSVASASAEPTRSPSAQPSSGALREWWVGTEGLRSGFPGWFERWFPRFVVLLLLATLVAMAISLLPNRIDPKPDAGWIELIIASRSVIAALRTLILFAAGYACLSLMILIWNGRWITRLAGIDTSPVKQVVSDVEDDRERLVAELRESEQTIEKLSDDLKDALDKLAELSKQADSPE